jgi:hypothetical protein
MNGNWQEVSKYDWSKVTKALTARESRSALYMYVSIYGNIIIILTLKREVFIPSTAKRFIKAISNIISRAHIYYILKVNYGLTRN